MSYWEKITILVHTRNRPDFLLRLIEYYNEKLGSSAINVIVLDGSANENFAKISEELGRTEYSLKVRVLHEPQSCSLSYRMAQALPLVSTPYVLLAADDDLYFFDWLEPAVDLLDSDSSYGVVYGHTLRFELEHFKPYGKLVRFEFSQKRNPPSRWLEADTPLERLTELGKSGWASTGWYALQRTEILSVIIDNSIEYQLDAYHLEKLLVFCQTALSRTRMLDHIYLARQIGDQKRPPYSFKLEGESFKQLLDASASILSQYKNIEMRSAIRMVEDVFRAEINALKRNDARKYLRIVADQLPYLRELKSRAHSLVRKKWPSSDPLLPDARFPSAPEIDSDHPRIKEIRAITESDR